MKRPRDFQKSRVYRAEAGCDFFLRDKQTIYDLGILANSIIQSRWWKARVPDVTYVDVKASKKGARRGVCYPLRKRINLPPFAQTEGYLLHEMAHLLLDRTKASHGPEYCSFYLELVRRHFGEEDADQLEANFDWYKVKVGPPTPVLVAPLSDRPRQYVRASGPK